MLTAPRWTHIALPVGDLDASVAFYEAFTPLALLSRRQDDQGQTAWLAHPGQVEHPFVLVLVMSWRQQGTAQPTMAPFAHLGIEVPDRIDVDRTAEQARGRGVPGVGAPGPAPAGGVRVRRHRPRRQPGRDLPRPGRAGRRRSGLGPGGGSTLMFTGIVEELGRYEGRDDLRFRFGARTVLDDIGMGDSIAVNGACLTVVGWSDGGWEADLSEETLARTTLGRLAPGDAVNLERAVRADQRIGGHLVQGHVDGVGEIVRPAPDLRVRVPAALIGYCVEKGSVTVDGVSLTCFGVDDDAACFDVAVIPHTAEVTTLGRRRPGAPVNIEVDVVAKYVERLVAPYRQARASG